MKGEELPGFQEDGEYSERAFESWLREQAILPTQVTHSASTRKGTQRTHSPFVCDQWLSSDAKAGLNQLPRVIFIDFVKSSEACSIRSKLGLQDEPAPAKSAPPPKSPEAAPAPTEVCQVSNIRLGAPCPLTAHVLSVQG